MEVNCLAGQTSDMLKLTNIAKKSSRKESKTASLMSAAEVGAPHKRDRVWIFATDTGSQRRKRCVKKKICRKQILPWGKNFGKTSDFFGRCSIPQPLIRRMADGGPFALDRLTALGVEVNARLGRGSDKLDTDATGRFYTGVFTVCVGWTADLLSCA